MGLVEASITKNPLGEDVGVGGRGGVLDVGVVRRISGYIGKAERWWGKKRRRNIRKTRKESFF